MINFITSCLRSKVHNKSNWNKGEYGLPLHNDVIVLILKELEQDYLSLSRLSRVNKKFNIVIEEKVKLFPLFQTAIKILKENPPEESIYLSLEKFPVINNHNHVLPFNNTFTNFLTKHFPSINFKIRVFYDSSEAKEVIDLELTKEWYPVKLKGLIYTTNPQIAQLGDNKTSVTENEKFLRAVLDNFNRTLLHTTKKSNP